MAERPKYGLIGGARVAGCSCVVMLIALTVLALAIGAPILSSGLITEAEVLSPWSTYCSSCCCCFGVIGVIAGLVIAVVEPRQHLPT